MDPLVLTYIFPSWHTRLGSSIPLNRIKALDANALSRFQSNSDRFKLAVVFGKLVNDCQLGTVLRRDGRRLDGLVAARKLPGARRVVRRFARRAQATDVEDKLKKPVRARRSPRRQFG
jgi:hypothetical protein